jgi:hypothetical protein
MQTPRNQLLELIDYFLHIQPYALVLWEAPEAELLNAHLQQQQALECFHPKRFNQSTTVICLPGSSSPLQAGLLLPKHFYLHTTSYRTAGALLLITYQLCFVNFVAKQVAKQRMIKFWLDFV